jgi:SagB-type dehydrogenase family enzyme
MRRTPQKKSFVKKNRATFLRRAPFLISYWQGNRLFFENYLTRRKIAASIETAMLLDFFSSWKREETMFRRWPEYSPRSLRALARRLTYETFLQRSPLKNPTQPSNEKALRRWSTWIPSAGFFHLSTKDTYSEEISPEEIRSVEELYQRKRVPQPLKKYPHAKAIPFLKERLRGEFPSVLRKRRTWRDFARIPVEKATLGRLLDLSFGVQEWERIPKVGRFALKTSPSGGGLHPCEAYILASNVRGVPRGVYHYDTGAHRLQLLRRETNSAEIQKLLAGQWWFRDAAFVVFLTAVFHRTQWKYDYPRAYRAVLAEAGHLCQTFCLTATWLDLAPFCTMAFADTKIENVLKIDGISESVLYAMGAGMKRAKK